MDTLTVLDTTAGTADGLGLKLTGPILLKLFDHLTASRRH
jgi:hypothetical protein